ncbi:MAG: MFS transporter [Prolixibacteraceae bacterium]|nr:MFS transporter [Prolixibacteraceae bacterium]
MGEQQQPKILWPILLTTMFASFMNPYMLAAVNISLPHIQEQFACSAKTLSWVSNSFLLANAIVLLPISRAADIWGRVRFFKIGLYIFTLFSLLSGLSDSVGMLLAMRVFQGAGAALMHVTGVAIITECYPPNKRGYALGLNIGAVYAGLSMGPFLGGIITQIGGWSLVFLSVVPLAVITIVLSHVNLRNVNIAKNHGIFDIKGSFLYAISIFLFIFGGGKIDEIQGVALFVAGLAMFVIFYIFEKKNRNPILNIQLLTSNRKFTFSNLAAFIHYSSTFGVSFILSLYLQFAKGLSPAQAGTILLAQPLVMVFTAPFTGRLSDKVNPAYLASAGLMVTFVALVGMAFFSLQSSVAYIVALLALLGLGFGLFTSPNTNSVMSAVDKKHYGIASGINATMRVFGQTISMMMVTVFITMLMGNESISTANIGLYLKSAKLYFIVFSVLSLLGIWFSIQRDKK